MLATLTDFCRRYGIEGGKDDAAVRVCLEGVSSEIARECGRTWNGQPCLERSAITLVSGLIERGKRSLWLPAWPIVEVAEVKEAALGDFAGADALVEDTDYILDRGLGRLVRIGTSWLAGAATIRIVFTGGYTAAETAEAEGYIPSAAWASGSDYTAETEVLYGGAIWLCTESVSGATSPPSTDPEHWSLKDFLLPADLREAALQQAGFTWQRRASLGLTSESVQGGAVSAYAKDELLPGVRKTCAGYRRFLG